ncbi:MAG TPA: o-succinylbenzoate synthase, partial [Adhaeribacter sp.]|nr:o-succinylbenzoate synthase [Adhaeribacter sp.]
MPLQLRFSRHDLQFRFDARTSRGKIEQHRAYYLQLTNSEEPDRSGWGEAAPLAGLSPDHRPDLETKLTELIRTFSARNPSVLAEARAWLAETDLEKWPALKFGLETAISDLDNGGRKILFDTAFSRGEAGIPINGLIWMGDETFMQEQIKQKLEQGYTCLKLKIGGLDFETECRILASVRQVAPAEKLTIRLDANGAFTPENALLRLERLETFGVHSLEQPVKPGQFEVMQKICRESPVPIALDEELIGITRPELQRELVTGLKPAFLILKPTLLGGLAETRNWIDLAEANNTGWWITSALESNIGLNAIAQFTSLYHDLIPQGLGTGQLYTNNIASPLQIRNGSLFYEPGKAWQAL